MLKIREVKTLEVVVRLSEKLNKFDKGNYIVFKSLKPYPATPNDTDIIYLGKKKKYKEMVQYLLDDGYEFHEWAPQQKTLFDSIGKDQIGKGKKGGTYYIDLYEEISTDYYAYLNRNVLRPYMFEKEINGVSVNLLKPEPELAIVLFHNVFPERTFQLEHFFLPLYYLEQKDFNISAFLDFVIINKMEKAIRTNFTFIAYLHNKYFGFVPEPVESINKKLGENLKELERYKASGLALPYMFSQSTFWSSFVRKTMEWYSFKSLILQAFKMLNPVFFLDVVTALKNRMSEKGVYHAE